MLYLSTTKSQIVGLQILSKLLRTSGTVSLPSIIITSQLVAFTVTVAPFSLANFTTMFFVVKVLGIENYFLKR